MIAGVLSADDVNAIRQHLLAYVRGRGPYAAVRVGNMPYGVLPVFGLLRETPPEHIDSAEPFERKLRWFLLKLFPRWRGMAQDVDAVPRAGGSNNPEQELIRILGMEGTGRHVHVRSIIIELYLWHLLRLMQPALFDPGAPWSLLSQGSSVHLQGWWQNFEATMEQSRMLYREFARDPTLSPQILRTVPWNPAHPFDGPLVTDAPLSEDHPLEGPPGAEAARPNYIKWLSEQNLATIRDDNAASAQSNALLFQLLRRSILLEESQSSDSERPTQGWIDGLASLPTAELERLLVESLDIASHRMDAWITSLATRRIIETRANGSKGIQLGAFGWVEDLKPAEKLQGGYIHAPSISHAATAAVLRSAYLTHANKENAEVMSINLTSERVRRSLRLLEGIREGQELGALLGYRFERGLHDRSGGSNGLELDKYISVFRQLHPLKVLVREGDEELAAGAVESVAARNVVDGLRLLDERDNIPFGQYGLPTAGPEYDAIKRELDALDDSLDALGDLGLAESVYQSVQGNYPRANALLESIAGNGRPPEPEVVQTPRSGFNLKHRVLVLFTGDPIQHNWAKTPRGIAEPHLDAWAAQLLGEPSHIKCTLRFPRPHTAGEGAAEQRTVVSLRDLNVGPLDFLYLAQSPAKGEATELEQRIAYHVSRAWAHVVVQIQGSTAMGQILTPDLDNASSYEGGILQAFSWSHTVASDDNTILIVGVSLNKNGAVVDAVTFGGQALTRLQRHLNAGSVELWYLLAPPMGTFDITARLHRSEQLVAGAASFMHVKQDAPFGNVTTNSATGITISTSADRSEGTILLDAWAKVGALGHAVAATGQTEIWYAQTETAVDADSNVQGGMSYVLQVAGPHMMRWASPVRVEFKRTDLLEADDLPIADVMPVAKKMLEIVGNARALKPLDPQLPEEAASADEIKESAEVLEQRTAEQLPHYNLLKQRLVTGDLNTPSALELITEIKKVLERADVSEADRRNAIFAAGYFGIQGAIQVDLAGDEFKAQVESVKEQVRKRHEACQQALDAATAIFDATDLAKITDAMQHLVSGIKVLFGKGFTVLPPFIPYNRDELALALDEQNTTALLDGENARWPVLWLQQLAQVRPEIGRFESFIMLAEALSGEARLTLRIAQLPHGSVNRWLALPYRTPNEAALLQGALSLAVHIPGYFDADAAYAGVVLGDWDEIIPANTETTAVAFHFNRPDAEPPNTLLLPVLMERENDEHVWTWDALVDCVESTLELAKIRAVDLDALKDFGRFLPALYVPVKLEERESA